MNSPFRKLSEPGPPLAEQRDTAIAEKKTGTGTKEKKSKRNTHTWGEKKIDELFFFSHFFFFVLKKSNKEKKQSDTLSREKTKNTTATAVTAVTAAATTTKKVRVDICYFTTQFRRNSNAEWKRHTCQQVLNKRSMQNNTGASQFLQLNKSRWLTSS